MKILVCDPLAESGLQKLRSIPDAEILLRPGLKGEDLLTAVKDVTAIVVRSETRITKEVIQHAKALKVIARAGIGIDNVDVEEATRFGVVVMNTPGGNSVTTAEHTLAMLFALCRNIPQAHKKLTQGHWDRKSFVGIEITGKTLGVIGLGNVGREVVRRALGLSMRVLGYDPYISEKAAIDLGVDLVSLDELYKESDFITVHTVLNEATKHLIGEEAFAKMKDGVRLINCARGGIVDEKALLEALQRGKVDGAAMDVFETEPIAADHPFLSHSKVIVTPHLGASTIEAQEQVTHATADQLRTFLMDEVVINGVNVPAVSREVLQALEDHLALSQTLGSFIGQLDLPAIRDVNIEYAGELSDIDQSPLTLAFLHGLLSWLTETHVNFVNARHIATERGINISETSTTKSMNYGNLITARVSTGKEDYIVSGTVFGKGRIRWVQFNGFFFDVVPQGFLLVIQNQDKPGVIGSWGTILGKHKINISQAQVAHDKGKASALSIVNIDSQASDEVLEELRAVANIESVRQLKL